MDRQQGKVLALVFALVALLLVISLFIVGFTVGIPVMFGSAGKMGVEGPQGKEGEKGPAGESGPQGDLGDENPPWKQWQTQVQTLGSNRDHIGQSPVTSSYYVRFPHRWRSGTDKRQGHPQVYVTAHTEPNQMVTVNSAVSDISEEGFTLHVHSDVNVPTTISAHILAVTV